MISLIVVLSNSTVALFTGAWIEIENNKDANDVTWVALFTGAWIEIKPLCINRHRGRSSHSLRVRGLKLYRRRFFIYTKRSHSLRVRGLKSTEERRVGSYVSVALFTGAWIEIWVLAIKSLVLSVALFTGAWIEIRHGFFSKYRCSVALFTGAWIEITGSMLYGKFVTSHSLRVRGLK